MNINSLTNKQKEVFVNGYSTLLKKWKEEFKPTLIQRILAFYARIVKKFMFKKDWKSYFENSITKRRELLKFANNDAEKEIINCWIIMDQETAKWKDYILEIILLQDKQKELSSIFNKTKKFEDAKNLLENQKKILSKWEILEKSALFKVNQQEKIKELGKKLKNIKEESADAILLGVITDIISKNQDLIGTQASLVYSFTKKYEPEILNSMLLTKRLKENSLKNRHKINVMLKDIKRLIREIKRNDKYN